MDDRDHLIAKLTGLFSRYDNEMDGYRALVLHAKIWDTARALSNTGTTTEQSDELIASHS